MKKILIWFLTIILSILGISTPEEENLPTCRVDNVDNEIISYMSIVCNNEDLIIYIEGNSIYSYRDNGIDELLIESSDWIEGMACTNDYIYYSVVDDSSMAKLYKYSFQKHETMLLHEAINITSLFTHGEDVFVGEISLDGMSKSILFSDDKEVYIEDLISECGENEYTEYGTYQFYVSQETGKLDWIYGMDGWKYCDRTGIVLSIQNEVISINTDEVYFDENKVDYSEDLEINTDSAAISRNHTSVNNGKIYLLYQFGKGTEAGSINPNSEAKDHDAIYCIDPETQEMTLIYETENNRTQIAGFSVERNAIYLLREDGVYQCDMDGNNEEKIFAEVSRSMLFADRGGQLFVYDDFGTRKLLIVI